MNIEELGLWIIWLQKCEPPSEVRADRRAALTARAIVAGEFDPKDFQPSARQEKPDADLDPETAMKQWCANAGIVKQRGA